MSFERCAQLPLRPMAACAALDDERPGGAYPLFAAVGISRHADNNEDMTNMHSRGSSTAEPASVVTSRPAPQRHSHRDVYFGLGH